MSLTEEKTGGEEFGEKQDFSELYKLSCVIYTYFNISNNGVDNKQV